MSNFNKFCLLFIVGMVYANTATAVDVSSQTANWGDGVLNTCGTHRLGFTDCIGISAKDDKITNPGETITWSCNTGKNMGIYSRSTAHDERAILMMVARQIQGNCARFCPIQIEARNQNKKSTWIEYVDATPSNNKNIYCVWLCQDGDWSAISSDPDAYDATELSWETYTGIKSVTQGSDIKKSGIALFKNEYPVCGTSRKQEHNMFLSIDSITNSKHGAYVKQMVVRANRSGYDNMYSWPEVYPASDAQKILVCKIGYKPNVQGTDCVVVSETAYAKQQMAPGFDDGQYDERIHKLIFNTETSKYEYRCKEADEGFIPKTHTCMKCINNSIHNGINPENGECVQCGAKAFNPGAAASSYCSAMMLVPEETLQYGTHKDDKFTDQCWTKDSSDYAECVTEALPKE